MEFKYKVMNVSGFGEPACVIATIDLVVRPDEGTRIFPIQMKFDLPLDASFKERTLLEARDAALAVAKQVINEEFVRKHFATLQPPAQT